MIALVAAVPFETELLRAELEPAPHGCWSGRIAGTDVVLSQTGVGKANAAASCTEIILQQHPAAMIMFGCGGAYGNSGLRIGDLALASCEIFGDEGSMTPCGFYDLEKLRLPIATAGGRELYNRIPVNASLLRQLAPSLEAFCKAEKRILQTGPFVTVSSCSGTQLAGAELELRTGGICENMEGAAAALVCCRHGLPLLEIRGISNLVADYNPKSWDLPAATRIAQRAVLQLLGNWPKEVASCSKT
jgi:futalosine hydrolase